MCQRCQKTPKNIALCKRSFAEYGTQTSLDVTAHNEVLKRNSVLGDEEYDADDERALAGVKYEMDTPVKDLVAAGADLEQIKSRICKLTGELPPLFHANNICVCKHEDVRFCLELGYTPVIELTAGTPGYLEHSWAPPLENVMLRAMMQLAARIIAHKDRLPFWNGLIAAAKGPEEEKSRFHVPPRPGNKLTDEKVLEHLTQVAGNIRFHFKKFQDLAHRIEGHLENVASGGYCASFSPDVTNPEPGFARLATLIFFAGDVEQPSFSKEQLEALFEPRDDKEPETSGEESSTTTFNAWRDGKLTLQDTPSPQVSMNLNRIQAYDMSNDDWQKMTNSELRAAVITGASKICHEFAHAMTEIYFLGRSEPYMNTDNIAEAGFAFENYVFGGGLVPGETPDKDYPSYIMVMTWPNYASWKAHDWVLP
jgi:hypothetical protein